MSTNKKNYPNDYYAWYNDDGRFAVVEKVTSSGDGSVHHDAYDSIQTSSDMLTGTMTEMVTDGSTVTVTHKASDAPSQPQDFSEMFSLLSFFLRVVRQVLNLITFLHF